MKLIFICAPYRATTQHGVMDNIATAARHAIEVINYVGVADAFPVTPHCNTALFDFDDRVTPLLRTDDDYWLRGTVALMSKCDLVYCPYLSKGITSGMKREIKQAEKLKIPVCHSLMDLQTKLMEN